jgi:class 3 adenylate cyclase
MVPDTRYARSGDAAIAYQVVGEGPRDIVYLPTWISHVEYMWEEPSVRRFFEALTSFARLIVFDRRGSGLSDPLLGTPSLEEQMDDVRAVMNAAGSERAAIFAQADAAMMAALFAASFPERTSALTLYSPQAHGTKTDDVPWALTPEGRETVIDQAVEHWGDGTWTARFAPSHAGDERLRQWFARLERLSASPGNVRRLIEGVADVDVRHVYPTIRVPTLILYRPESSLIEPRHARYLAERIPGAKLVALPGEDTLITLGDLDATIGEIEEFLTGARQRRARDRVLATVLFTDIVDSTSRAAELGDRRWRQLLESHDVMVRRELARYEGREVKSVGDGFLATFAGPARAIRCASAVTHAAPALGLQVRAGLHTGEVEVIGEDVGGLAVHIGARVAAQAQPGEVLVSGTVKDLVVGSGLEFADRGTRALRGVPGEWRLYAVGA